MFKSLIHDFKYKYAKPIKNEISIWTKISRGTVFGKSVLIKCIIDEKEFYTFIKIDEETYSLLSDEHAILEFLKKSELFEDVYTRIFWKDRFYFNGKIVNVSSSS